MIPSPKAVSISFSIDCAASGMAATKGPSGGLLALHGIRRWVPHDVRRALATFLDDQMPGGSASAILDHAMDKEVARLHYSRAQRMELKALGMELWCRAILDAHRREKVAWRSSASRRVSSMP